MTDRSHLRTFAWAVFAIILPAAAHAQSYTIAWSTMDGGGGSASSGSYALSGTIGQADASGELAAGAYSLAGGFLPAGTPLAGALGRRPLPH